MTSLSLAEEKRQKAQLHFEKAAQRKIDATKSYDSYRAEKNAELAKTIRLRALRLAKEAADAVAATEKQAIIAAAPKAVRKRAPRKTEKRVDAKDLTQVHDSESNGAS